MFRMVSKLLTTNDSDLNCYAEWVSNRLITNATLSPISNQTRLRYLAPRHYWPQLLLFASNYNWFNSFPSNKWSVTSNTLFLGLPFYSRQARFSVWTLANTPTSTPCPSKVNFWLSVSPVSLHQSTRPFASLFFCLFACLSVCLFVRPFVCLFSYPVFILYLECYISPSIHFFAHVKQLLFSSEQGFSCKVLSFLV